MVKNLKLLRTEHRISQQKLAEMLEITQQAVFKYEKTAVEPDIATLIRMAEIFDVSVDFLIGNTDSRQNKIIQEAALTTAEYEHIKKWRKLSPTVRGKAEELITEMTK